MGVFNFKIKSGKRLLDLHNEVEFNNISHYTQEVSQTKFNFENWLRDFIKSNKKNHISEKEINQYVTEAKSKRYEISN